MSRFFLPLFWKIAIGIVFAVLLFNFIHIYFIRNSIRDSLRQELTLRGAFIARSIAERALPHILYSDPVELNKIVDETKKIDSSIAYVFILNSRNEVLSHTFQNGVPPALIAVHREKNNSNGTVLIEPVQMPGKHIRDIASPVLDAKIGTVRIGLYEDMIQKTSASAFRFLIFLVLIFLAVGLLMAFIFSYIITAPVKFISQAAVSINIGSFRQISEYKKRFENNFFYRIRRLLFSYDEIDILYRKFTEMVERLEKTNNELQSAHNSLLRSEKMASIGVLTAGIAHEINNPVSGLQNCIRRIAHQPDNIAQNIQYLNLMNDAVNKIEKVVQGLLHFSRKHEFKLTAINLNVPLDNALLLAAFHIEKNNISVRKEIIAQMPVVYGSQNHLEQVFLNLIINSVDAIVEKKAKNGMFSPEILFVCRCDDQRLFFEIHDSGMGISETHMNRIFDPFFTTKKIGQGTGLGLAISYNIIKDHKGDIEVKSEYGKGTTVTLKFPIN